MAVETKNRDNVGRVEVRVKLTYSIALEDPKGEGNWGLEGYDEFHVERGFPNGGLARSWVEHWTPPKDKPTAEAVAVTVYYEHWEADSFDDDKYGVVLDAELRTDQTQEGWPDSKQAGGWNWEEPEQYNS